MAQHFKSDAKTFNDLFVGVDKPRLVVPPFQRGYSWEKKHVEAFWDDLMDYMAEKRELKASRYFLGPIVILEKDDGPFEVLDGQQRLATATIVFASIRDAAKQIGSDPLTQFSVAIHNNFIIKDDAGENLGFILTLGNLDKDYFQQTVQEFPPSDPEALILSNTYIAKAKAIIAKKIQLKIEGKSGVETLSWLKELRKVIMSDLVMTYIPVQNDREAFQIFETLNDRGLKLSAPDLLLNYLMKEADEKDRPTIRGYWDQMASVIGQRNATKFLRAVWVSEFGDLKEKDLFTAIRKQLRDTRADSLVYARTCAQVCDTYCAILDCDKDVLGDAAKRIQTLLGPLNCQAAIPLLMSACYWMSKDGLEKLSGWLVVFVVRFSVIAEMENSTMETLFFGLARDVRAASPSKNVANNAKAESECLRKIKERLATECPGDEKIRSSMESLILSPRDARYVISTICNRLQSERKETGAMSVSLEHVFPLNPSAEWKNATELSPLTWHIGNLTMLGKKLNGEEARNRGYDFKRPVYQNSQLNMANAIAKNYTQWTPESIRSRARHLGDEVVGIWRFENLSTI